MTRQQQAPSATVTTPSDREIRIEREFDAPRDRVFAVYTDPELIPEWWGPRGTTADRRPDGRRAPAATGASSRATPTAARPPSAGPTARSPPPERIVQTFEWEGMPGHVSVETATFEDLGDAHAGSSTMSLFHTTEERDGMLGSGMEGGMNETYERLDELLARRA